MKIIITETQLNKLKETPFNINQKILREYIKILKNNYNDGFIDDYNKFDIMITYFTIIHNFLFIEERFKNEVIISGKEINLFLNLPKLTSLSEVESEFHKLYDVNSKIRFSIETFDSIENIRKVLINNPKLFNKVYMNLNKVVFE